MAMSRAASKAAAAGVVASVDALGTLLAAASPLRERDVRGLTATLHCLACLAALGEEARRRCLEEPRGARCDGWVLAHGKGQEFLGVGLIRGGFGRM